MKIWIRIYFLLASVLAFSQATPPGYPYPNPLPTNGNITGAVLKVTSPVGPTAYNDPFPAVWDDFFGGGYRAVATTAERNNINSAFRKEGMLVWVAADSHTYQLSSNLTSWTDLGVLGSGGGATTLYNGSSSLTGNRIVTGAGFSLDIDGISTGSVYANSSYTINAPTINVDGGSFTRINHLGPYPFVFAAAPSLAAADHELLARDPVTGEVTFNPIATIASASGIYRAVTSGTPGTWVAATADLTPSYDSGSQPPEATVAILKFPSNSVGADTLQFGDSTTGIPITRINGDAIEADDISAGEYLVFIRSGTSSGSHWTCISCDASTAPAPASSMAITVDSVEDLIALDVSQYNKAVTLGYYTPNDGGAAVYYWVADTTSTNHGSKLASLDSGSWVLTGTSIVNVLQWGAVKDGATPTAARINEAIDYAGTLPDGRRIWIPPGQYAIEETLFVRYGNVHIRQNGWLRNVNGTNDTTFVISPAWLDHSIAITNGVPTYEASNVTIDGDGIGVIDQNSQNATAFASTNAAYGSFHTFVAYGVDGLNVKNLIITNGIVWGMTIELCNHFNVTGNKVYNGLCNNRTVDGIPTYLGGQDGIHPHDSANGNISDNYVISGDDAIVITSARAYAHDITATGNRAVVRPIAYEADGVTQNTNSVQGRYALAAYCAAQTTDCGLTNITFNGNIISGGSGLFGVYDDGVAHSGIPSAIKFIGNTFSDIVSPGATLPVPSLDQGWIVNGSDGVEFIGNTFKNIARWGRLGGGYSTLNSVVVFKDNLFSGFQIPYPENPFPGQAQSVIWMANNSQKLVVTGNTFINNAIVPVGIGSTGDTTTNYFQQAIINGNQFFNNNTRYSGATPTNYSAAVFANGVNFLSFSGNTISTNYGHAVLARAIKSFEANGNNIRGIGNGSFSDYGDVFRILDQADVSLLETSIRNNIVRDVDGRLIELYNPGTTVITGNDAKNLGRSYNTDYAVAINVTGTALSDQPYIQWGGYFFGNTFSRASAQSPFYITSSISAGAYTGPKFRYGGVTNNFFNSVYTAETITANAAGLIE